MVISGGAISSASDTNLVSHWIWSKPTPKIQIKKVVTFCAEQDADGWSSLGSGAIVSLAISSFLRGSAGTFPARFDTTWEASQWAGLSYRGNLHNGEEEPGTLKVVYCPPTHHTRASPL